MSDNDRIVEGICDVLETECFYDDAVWLRAHLAAKDAEIARLTSLNETLSDVGKAQSDFITKLKQQLEALKASVRGSKCVSWEVGGQLEVFYAVPAYVVEDEKI